MATVHQTITTSKKIGETNIVVTRTDGVAMVEERPHVKGVTASIDDHTGFGSHSRGQMVLDTGSNCTCPVVIGTNAWIITIDSIVCKSFSQIDQGAYGQHSTILFNDDKPFKPIHRRITRGTYERCISLNETSVNLSSQLIGTLRTGPATLKKAENH
ncbi:hypothetical protein CHS0354_018881 [Potamilus streckersoni]|uniref:Uncharacterized protein n=1 Tax=Potamilus streckersoni TaxID=2493646 RepID=A0AAE0SBW3_9BIVA|nr:hypothetical protein CHS0354_018881 [Potamilus streckersoni]